MATAGIAVRGPDHWFEPRPRRSDALSARERGILTGIAGGHSTEGIAADMNLSPHTVRTHVKRLMRKLGANTRAHAVAIALSEGAIEVDL